MKLFKSPLKFSTKDLNILSISTPLGMVYFDFLFNGMSIREIKPTETNASGETLISYWDVQECHVEFLRGNIIPKIPSGMEVEGCVAGMWRIKNKGNNLKTTFETHFGDKEFSAKFEANPESGEGLLCQSFENDFYKISIGTEDEDYLNQRAYGKSMPSRFRNLITPNMVEYTPEGLQIDLPRLENGECVQIQFVIAWTPKKHPEVSTWFAVGQAPSYILQSLDVEE